MTRSTAQLAIVAAVLLAAAAPAGAKPKVRCSSGTTIFLDGALRIFGVAFHEGSSATGEASGHDEYACLGSRGPFGVGQEFDSSGTASADTPGFVLAGGRYLGVAQIDIGEGGGSLFQEISDLKRDGRRVAFRNVPAEDPPPPFRVTSAAKLVTAVGSVEYFAQAVKGDGQTLSSPGVEVSELALTGTTLYWTEHPTGQPAAAHSAPVPGDAAAGENSVYEPVVVRTAGGRCARRSGTTVARSPSVRVFERRQGAGKARRYACRLGSRRAIALRPRGIGADMRSTAVQIRIVSDRWLFALDGPGAATADALATVYDTRAARLAMRVSAKSFRATTVAGDGTLAWIDDGGSLMAGTPGATAPGLLAPAADGPRALASSRSTIYWTTADGTAHRSPAAAVPEPS